jgi:cell division protease FtsH
MPGNAQRLNQQDQEQPQQRKPFDPMTERGQQSEPPQWVRVLNFLLLVFLIFYAVQMFTESNLEQLTFTEFKERVTAGQVSEVTIEGHQVRGTLQAAEGGGNASGKRHSRVTFPRSVTQG